MSECESSFIKEYFLKTKNFLCFRFHSFKIFFALAVATSLTNGQTFNCQFWYENWQHIGYIYGCNVAVVDLVIKDLVIIDGPHLDSKTNNEVIGLNIWNQNLRKIPQGIDTHFKNIKAFQVFNSKLGTILKEDLKQFPDLILLSIIKNDILVLDGDLLMYNRKLESVAFTENLLMRIGPNLVKGLNTLVGINFHYNPCVSTAASSPQAIQALNDELPLLCPPISTECPDTCKKISSNEERIIELEKQIREISSRP